MTASMPWVKLYTEMVHDPKIGLLSKSAQLLFVKLILIAGECDADGLLVKGEKPMTADDIAWLLRDKKTQITSDIDELVSAKVISVDASGLIEVVKFQERQGRSQEDKRAQWKAHQAVRRDKVSIAVYQRAHGMCEYCGCAVTRELFVVDHITPPFMGGSHTSLENLACACRSCNAKKGEKTLEELDWRNPRINIVDVGSASATVSTQADSHKVIADTTEVINDISKVIALEERESREREEKSKSADASPRKHDLLFDAVSEVTSSNPKLQGSRIAKVTSDLRKIGATPEQVRQVAEWYLKNDWRGRKGEKLTFASLVDVWESGIRNAPAPGGNGKGAPKESPWDIAMTKLMSEVEK